MSRGTSDSVESKNVELVGAAEAADILGVPRSSVARWLKNGKFPMPLAKLRATPVWREEDIRKFGRARERKRAEREKATA